MTVLSVDPGLWKTGCALWSSEGQLLRAWTQRQGKCSEVGPTLWRRMALSIKEEEPCVLVIEVMQVDGRTRGKEKDLFSLSGVIGAICVRFSSARIVSYTPTQWKGSLPKDIMRERVKNRLTSAELTVIAPKATHDAWDAIGIGAKYWSDLGHMRWKRSR